jgi:hypothetical protein
MPNGQRELLTTRTPNNENSEGEQTIQRGNENSEGEQTIQRGNENSEGEQTMAK